jgi:putative ABC transport system permease protein
MILQTLLMALREIRRNALRSFLTMLGVIIGVGSVIAMVTIGNGATAKVRSDVAALGQNMLMVMPGTMRRGGPPTSATPFTEEDINAIRREVHGIEAIAGTASDSAVAIMGADQWSTSITGADNDYLIVRNYQLRWGREFAPGEITAGTPVCILGNTVAQKLFKDAQDYAKRIRVGRVSCQVIGVLMAKGAAAMGPDQDDLIVMPLRAVQHRMIGNTYVSGAYVKVATTARMATVKDQIEILLRERRRLARNAESDFSVQDLQEVAQAMSSVTAALTGLLGGIAAVSLLVGGIGIMNIMLVSVTERTREIGTRLAIGALAHEVLLQFLVEATVLSTLGGVFGILFGFGLSALGTRLLQVPFIFSAGITIAAFVFSAAVGILFGYLPARRAARMNPIEALRHE